MIVLIADDEQPVRSMVRRLLGDKYIVLEAADGEAAVQMACSYKPDIILMDITMPKMSGYAACSAIKTNPVTKGIPVVMLTDFGRELDKKNAEAMGASGYIPKPFKPQELLDAISKFS